MISEKKSERQRPFKGKYGHQLGLDYHFNHKAWMNRSLFFSWLERLDKYIKRTTNRNFLLFIHNFFAHGTKRIMNLFQSILESFFPPSIKSRVQPLIGGIIAQMKGKFQCQLLFRVLDNFFCCK